MTTIIKLLIAALMINACAQVGMAFFKQYQFQDAMQGVLLFAPDASEAQLTERIVELAAEHDVPLEPSDVAIISERFERSVEAPYVEEVTLVPFVYARRWAFSPATSVKVMPSTIDRQ